jgi:hypothetical protein
MTVCSVIVSTVDGHGSDRTGPDRTGPDQFQSLSAPHPRPRRQVQRSFDAVFAARRVHGAILGEANGRLHALCARFWHGAG